MKIDENTFDLASFIVAAASLNFAASTPQGSILNSCDLASCVAPRLCPETPIRKNRQIAPPEGSGPGVAPHPDIPGTPLLEVA